MMGQPEAFPLQVESNVINAAHEAASESLSEFRDTFQQAIDAAPKQSNDAAVVYLSPIASPVGVMLAGATDQALSLLEFADREMLAAQLERIRRLLKCSLVPGSNAIIRNTESQLRSYFEGTLREFTLPLGLNGSQFQQSVWRALCEIPYGTTRSYAAQALQIGRPDAVRAVARANGDNRIAIIIPCHRVVGSDGKLTGYGGGLWRKKLLLQHEERYAGTALSLLLE
jgi:AraC family transcriptional regulator of adaptative response/methylated-DNA-[protein]-cysteine methyltransferase